MALTKISGDILKQPLNVGIITATSINVSGITTLGITSATSLVVSGISTLGITTATNLTSQSIVVSGISTLGITSTTNLTSQSLVVSGISTLGITSATNLTSQSLVVSGISTLGITSAINLTSQSLSVSGIITFTNGPILVGTATSTGTASQPLQVTGGAYVSGSVGIGTINPSAKLDVEDNSASGYIAEFRQKHTSNSAQILIDSPTNGESRPVSMDMSRAGVLQWSIGQAYLDTNQSFHIATSTLQSGNTGSKLSITQSGNVGIGTITPQYKLHVVGSFAATTKSFVITHPTKQNYKLQHGSLEGPELGVYIRGRTTENIIELPEYWTELVDKNSITVNLTPIGDNRVWIEEINNNKVYIDSNSDIDCFYTVFAERKDVEKLIVEIEEN